MFTMGASDLARTETRALRMVASAAARSMALAPILLLPSPFPLEDGCKCLGILLGLPQPLDSVSGLSSLASNLFPF